MKFFHLHSSFALKTYEIWLTKIETGNSYRPQIYAIVESKTIKLKNEKNEISRMVKKERRMKYMCWSRAVELCVCGGNGDTHKFHKLNACQMEF